MRVLPSVLTNNTSSSDTGAPVPTITTNVVDPVLDASVACYVTFSKGPIIGFTSADITVTNCTVSNFTQRAGTNNIWDFDLNPVIDGDFTAQIGAGTCTWNTISNSASTLFSRTYDSGASYDLVDANVSFDGLFRGHIYGVSDCNDLLSATNVAGMEMLFTKYNFGATMFANGDNTQNRNIHKFGRLNFGCIVIGSLAGGNNSSTVIPLITNVRGGLAPSTMSYKNGVTDYSALMLPYFILGRNSGYETKFGSQLAKEFGGIAQASLNPRQSTFRYDYYAKTTQSNYYESSLDIGITGASSLLEDYIGEVKNVNGWFTDFVHWHWQIADYPEIYLSKLDSLIGSDDVARLTHQEFAEGSVIIDSVDSVTASGNTITVHHSKKFTSPAAPYDAITTPCWVRLDTTGSVFEGEDIACNNGLRIRSMGSNIFYIPIILDFDNATTTVSIGISAGPDYVNLNAIDIQRSGTTITTDQLCKLKIWRWAKPTTLGTSVTSVAIPTTDNTTVNMTTQTGLSVSVGTTVKVLNDSTHYFYATVLSYTSGTGEISLSSSSNTGTGTFASWTIQRWTHRLSASEVQIFVDNFDTSFTMTTSPDTTNFFYAYGAINKDSRSTVKEE